MVEIGYALSSEEHLPQDLIRHAHRAEEVGRLFVLSMASSGLSEILDPIFPLLSYLSGYINKIEKTKQAEMAQEEILRTNH